MQGLRFRCTHGGAQEAAAFAKLSLAYVARAQDSWEPEEHVPEDLIELFRSQNPALFEARVAAAAQAGEAHARPATQALSGRGGHQLQAAPVAPQQTPLPESVPLVLSGSAEQQQDRVLAGSM